MMTASDRYRTDAHFHALVNVMRGYIEAAQFTPSELREAAILAAVMYEAARPVPVRIKLAETAVQALEQAERDEGSKKRP